MLRVRTFGTDGLCAAFCSSLTFLVCFGPEAIAQFCPDSGTVHSTTDQATGDAPFAVRACDLDGDGDSDLATANEGTHTVSVLLNNGDGTYAAPSRWTTTTTPFDPICCEEPVDFDCCTEPVDVACCDVNGDTHIDLITVNHTSDDVSVLLNDGSTQFTAPVRYTVGEAPFGVECLSVDGDADFDLVTNGFTEDAISVLLNNGDGTFATHVTYAVGDAPIAMTLCDVNGDSDRDVVTANMLSKDVSVLRNNSDGTFTRIGSYSVDVNPFDVTCCDLDGVNGPDVATANGIADTVTVLFNDGTGGYGSLTSYGGVDGAWAATCCDLDGDAHFDVVSGNLVSDDLAVFLNDGSGTLGTPLFLSVGSDSTADPSSVVCCNVDGDADNDLVATFIDGVTIFENDCGGCTADEECDDGNVCTDDTCTDGDCRYTNNTDPCDDSLFCTTSDGCSGGTCVGTGDPCPGQLCNEDRDACVDCLTNADCPEGMFCGEYDGICSPCPPPVVVTEGSRYVGVTPQPGPPEQAIWVTGEDPDVSCVYGFVRGVVDKGRVDQCDNPPCDPDYLPPGEQGWDTVHVRGFGLFGGRTYSIQTDCGPENPGTLLSDPVSATLWRWGDTNRNGNVGIDDATRILDGFRGMFYTLDCTSDQDCTVLPAAYDICDTEVGKCLWITLEQVDITGAVSCLPEKVVTIRDVTLDLDGFRGFPDPCAVTCP